MRTTTDHINRISSSSQMSNTVKGTCDPNPCHGLGPLLGPLDIGSSRTLIVVINAAGGIAMSMWPIPPAVWCACVCSTMVTPSWLTSCVASHCLMCHQPH